VVPALLAVLQAYDTQALKEALTALVNLSYGPHAANQERIGSNTGVVPALQQILETGDAEAQALAAWSVRNLCSGPCTSNIERFSGSPGVLRCLTQMLHTTVPAVAAAGCGTGDCQRQALKALGSLSFMSGQTVLENQDRFAAEGLVAAVVRLLQAADPELRRHSLHVLINICSGPHGRNQDHVGSQPYIAPALAAILEADVHLQDLALQLLVLLWSGPHSRNQELLSQSSKLLAALILLLQAHSIAMKTRSLAAQAVLSLCFGATAAVKDRLLDKEDRTIASLCSLLEAPDLEARCQAAAALRSLCYRHMAGQDRVGRFDGTMPAIVRLLEEGDDVGSKEAAMVIVNLCYGPHLENQKRVGENPHVVSALFGLLQTGAIAGKVEAAGALGNLCSGNHAGNQDRVGNDGRIVPALLDAMEAADAPGRAIIAATFWNLAAGHLANRHRIVACRKVIDALQSMAISDDRQGRACAIGALECLDPDGNACCLAPLGLLSL
jgi:hypothetical protein